MITDKEVIKSVFESGKSFKEYIDGMSEIYGLLFKASYEEYTINKSAIERVKSLLANKSLNILVLSAEWCPDSRRNVPALAKIVENIESIKLSIHEVNKGDELSTKFGLVKIPTIIIYDKNWTELGRIVENPSTGSIEQDLEQILSKVYSK